MCESSPSGFRPCPAARFERRRLPHVEWRPACALSTAGREYCSWRRAAGRFCAWPGFRAAFADIDMKAARRAADVACECRSPMPRCWRAATRVVAALARDRAGRGRDRGRARDAALRVGRADRLPAASDGGGAAIDHRAGLPRARLLPRRRHQGGAARRRHVAVGRRAAARRRRPARHGQVQPHPRDRFRQPRRGGRAGRDQPRRQPGGRARRLLLRARSVLADRLHHRRQRGGEFRRRALPEIRHDHQQSARLRDRADDRRDRPHRRQASRRRRLRPARRHHRLGGAARRRHRDHGAHPEEAGMRARRAGRLCLLGGRRRMREPDHRRRHHPGRHGDDGQARHPRGRGIRPRRLSARRRGAADRRGRRPAGRRSIISSSASRRSPGRAGR